MNKGKKDVLSLNNNFSDLFYSDLNEIHNLLRVTKEKLTQSTDITKQTQFKFKKKPGVLIPLLSNIQLPALTSKKQQTYRKAGIVKCKGKLVPNNKENVDNNKEKSSKNNDSVTSFFNKSNLNERCSIERASNGTTSRIKMNPSQKSYDEHDEILFKSKSKSKSKSNTNDSLINNPRLSRRKSSVIPNIHHLHREYNIINMKPNIDINKGGNKIKRKHHELSVAGNENKKTSKINQDSYFMLNGIFGIVNCDIFGVMDGHGDYGDLVSNYIRKEFINHFSNSSNYETLKENGPKKERDIYKDLTNDNYSMITSLYSKLENKLFSNMNIKTSFSGSTCVIVYCINNNIICSNTGDSRAILVSKYPNGIFKSEPLSVDHKPTITKERHRIERSGGMIGQIIDEKNDGIYRVWVKGETYPGIAMSRSIGDEVATNIGVISTPDIIEKEIKKEMCYIIVGSDGLWEFLDNDAVIKIATLYYINNDAKGLCQALLTEAKNKWKKEDITSDDITCIVYFIRKYNPNNESICMN